MSAIISYLTTGFVYYAALTALLFTMSLLHPIFGFFARLLASYFALILCASYGVAASLLLRLLEPFGLGDHRIAQWATARSFKYTMWLLTGITFEIDDPNDYLSKTRPAVFIGNHQTELDVLMLAWIFPKYCSVTAKRSLKRVPFLGWFMALSGTVFIDRANSQSARGAMAGAAEEMREHRQSVYMFPEGTRSYYTEPGFLPFKKGAFHLAVQAKVPIVPVVVANYSDVLGLKTWTFRGGKIRVKVLPPIDTSMLTAADVEDLARDTREKMLKEHIAITARARGQKVPMQAAIAQDKATKASGVDSKGL